MQDFAEVCIGKRLRIGSLVGTGSLSDAISGVVEGTSAKDVVEGVIAFGWCTDGRNVA